MIFLTRNYSIASTIYSDQTGFGLMVGVFVMHSKRSGSSDSPSKARVVHVVLLIRAHTEDPLFYLAKKKKKHNLFNNKYELFMVCLGFAYFVETKNFLTKVL